MFLEDIKVNNFRIHKDFYTKIPEFLYIVGSNGSGKTSLIEAIYLILTLRYFKYGFRDVKTRGEQFLRVESNLHMKEDLYNIKYFNDGKKTVLINNNKNEDIISYSVNNLVLCYSPKYESILSDDQIQRRNFIDRIIFYTDKSYINLVRKYNQLLLRKKKELFSNNIDKNLLILITDMMLPISKELSHKRETLISDINKYFKNNKNSIFTKNFTLSLSKENYTRYSLDDEISSKKILVGAHREKINLTMNNTHVERFQSYGQKKSILLNLIYFFKEYLNSNNDLPITLLLDDFEAGLDSKRQKTLYELFFSNINNSQIIITGLNSDNFKSGDKLNLDESFNE